MLHTLAISGYRTLKNIVLPLAQLNLITGPNGSGKSNLYKSLRLLAQTAEGQLIRSLAREGGLPSALWAGPEAISAGMKSGEFPIQGTLRKKPVSLKLGFSSDDFCYTIELGLPGPGESPFMLDPVIKRECVWRGPIQRTRDLVVDRRKRLLRCRGGRSKSWQNIELGIAGYTSIVSEYADPENAPELILLRDEIRSWRFYDHFRTDSEAPARRTEVGTFTPVMSADGADLAAAVRTIYEIGDGMGFNQAVADAFPGSQLMVQNLNEASNDSRLEVVLEQPGMLRPLTAAELSDGTLRYLLIAAALFTPRPPSLMVLNEPETSLHPDLLPALGRMILTYSENEQVVVVTHSKKLIETLSQTPTCNRFQLEKSFGATQLLGLDPFDLPRWEWPAR